jgi:hypothetical protein
MKIYVLIVVLFINQFKCKASEGIDRPSFTVESVVNMEYLPQHLAVVKINFRNIDINQSTTLYGSMNGASLNYTVSPEKSIETTTNAGKYVFEFYYNASHYEVKSDSIILEGGTKTTISVYFKSSSQNQLMKKPVIYYYGENKDSVSIKLKIKGELTFTYPMYNEAWKFQSDTNGNISINNKQYPYLFWEGNCVLPTFDIDKDDGFYISREELVPFLETNLLTMGFTSKEATDFITFWAPQMVIHDVVFIHFYFKETIDAFATLNVHPKPESVFRLYMLWQASAYSYNSTKPQKIPTFKRKGTTLIEWGGCEITP